MPQQLEICELESSENFQLAIKNKALLQLVGRKYFFADFRFTDIKIGTRGFSGTVIPNLATVLL